jgi:hypothetical protein
MTICFKQNWALTFALRGGFLGCMGDLLYSPKAETSC